MWVGVGESLIKMGKNGRCYINIWYWLNFKGDLVSLGWGKMEV